MGELLGQARRLRKKNKIDESDQVIKDVIDFFYSRVSTGSAAIEKIYDSLRKGKIPVANRTPRFSAENTLGTGRGYCNGMGTHTAAMYCGGQPGSGYVATVEEWTAGLGVITFTDS